MNPQTDPLDRPRRPAAFRPDPRHGFRPRLRSGAGRGRSRERGDRRQPDAPDFANTIAAMETADEDLNRVLSVFYTLAGVDSNDARQALQRDFAPRLAEYGSRISMDPRLYARVRAVAAAADGLSPEDRRITELALRDLTRAGRAWTRRAAPAWPRSRPAGRADHRVHPERADGRT